MREATGNKGLEACTGAGQHLSKQYSRIGVVFWRRKPIIIGLLPEKLEDFSVHIQRLSTPMPFCRLILVGDDPYVPFSCHLLTSPSHSALRCDSPGFLYIIHQSSKLRLHRFPGSCLLRIQVFVIARARAHTLRDGLACGLLPMPLLRPSLIRAHRNYFV